MTASLERHFKAARDPQTSLIRQRLCFDGGYRTTAWISPTNQIKIIPSIIKNLENWEDCQPDLDSVLIEFKSDRFCIGQQAKFLGGKPAFQNDKIDLAPQLLLAALEPNPDERVVSINELLITLPDSRDRNAVEKLKALEGTYEFLRNGHHVVASVRRVIPVDETKGAYALAKKQNLFLSQTRPNAVLDLGGGTSIARIYSPSGSLLRDADVILPGTFALAKRIDAALLSRTGQSQDLTLILDAIANASFEIGTTGINFESEFEKAHKAWLDEIREKVKTKWSEYLPQLGEVLIIGGSAPLALPYEAATNGRFKIAPNPQTFNLQGLGVI